MGLQDYSSFSSRDLSCLQSLRREDTGSKQAFTSLVAAESPRQPPARTTVVDFVHKYIQK
jgi:hypothetical protein